MYNLIMYAHIATVVPCIFLGAFALFSKKRNKLHKQKLIGLYIGAIVIAGSFTFFPGRFMHQLFFG